MSRNQPGADALNDEQRHQLEHHARGVVDGIKNMAHGARQATKAVKSIGTAVHEVMLQFVPGADEDPVKGQYAGAPRIGRKSSAREIRRMNGDFQNAAGTWSPDVSMIGERYFDGRKPDVVLYPSTRAIKRVTAGRTR